MNHTQKSSSFPHTLRTRQFYGRKKPLFEIRSLLFSAARMPQDRPPPTRPLQIRNRTAVRLGFAPSDRGLILSLNRCRCRRCRLRVFFARFTALRQSPPIAKTKILTFRNFFSITDSLPFPQSGKRAVLQLFTAFFKPRSAYWHHPTIRNRKKVAS